MSNIDHNRDRFFSEVVRFNHKIDFNSLEIKEVLKKNDKELALWQSNYGINSPQYILADYEWQRRLTFQQIKATRFAAWIGLLGVVIGVILGLLLGRADKIIDKWFNDKIQVESKEKGKNDQGRPISPPEPLTTEQPILK
jgi:hypothetical protein